MLMKKFFIFISFCCMFVNFAMGAMHDNEKEDISHKRTVAVFLEVKPEKREEFMQEVKNVQHLSKQESTCLEWTIHQAEDNPCKFLVYEIWTSLEGHKLQFDKPYVRSIIEKLPDFLVEGSHTKFFANEILFPKRHLEAHHPLGITIRRTLKEDELKEVGRIYINFLKKVGEAALFPSEDIETLFSKTCKKVENGHPIANSRLELTEQLNRALAFTGRPWMIEEVHMLADIPQQACIVHFTAKTTKLLPHTTMAILKIDPSTKNIYEINEVFAKVSREEILK